MAIIHRTTMSPGKLELLGAWLPAQPWYHGAGRAPELAKAGGFRLDDPQGEVGIEFMVVTAPGGQLMVRLHRAVRPGDTADAALQPCLWAPWRLPDGPPARGVLVGARYRPSDAGVSGQRPAAPAG